ncbi:hypothetical protein D6C00_06360 [Thiohalobacter thiocyanaticus]|uniref:Uncharacterized protein n=1 Tax=Thiohalobacter thiocyanaticus TaxID=585455 RepID=A0A426QIL1_9GAMM|nr:hypothetical protein D6C00_06360 [Thiohalobacter thiocyanaticus]
MLVSSVALVALGLGGQNGEWLTRAAKQLERYYFRHPELHRPYAPVVFAALSLVLGGGISRRTVSEVARYANRSLSLSDKYVYFFDYKESDDKWSREYFIVPVALFVPLVICEEGIPGSYRLKGEEVIKRLEELLDKNGGAYRPRETDRIAALEHGLAALALDQYARCKDKKGVRYKLNQALYELRKEREGLDKLGSYLMAIAYLMLVIIIIAVPAYNINIGPVEDAFVKASLFIMPLIESPQAMTSRILGR